MAFLRVGWLVWPYGHWHDAQDVLPLFYSHISMALIMAAAVVWISRPARGKHLVAWGTWGRLSPLLVIACLIVWIWAILQIPRSCCVNIGGFIAVLTMISLKSILTGVGEEIVYRGLIMPAATNAFGLPAGVVVQALFYGLFHVFVSPAIFKKLAFLALVFCLGLLLGLLTQRTRGIAWGSVVHTALDMAVEWQNFSSLA